MARRVARVAVSSAAFGGLAAALVAIVAVDRLITDQAEVRLRAATVTLAGELDEERKGPWLESLREVLDDENQEIVTSGIRLAALGGGEVLAGDSAVPAVAPGRCTTELAPGGRVRACARAYRKWVLVAAQRTDEGALYGLYVLSLLGAVGLGAAAGALSSRALTRWAVGPLEALAQALRASPPSPARLLELGPASDVEEVEAVRAALAERARQIQGLLAQTERFAADAAHELRTPLTALRAELELLAEEGRPSDPRALERAVARVARLGELVNRLLILALPERELSAQFEAVALADVVEDVVAELGPAERARVELELDGEGMVRGDSELLRSLVANAIGNALKFGLDGKVELRLAAAGEPGAESVVLEVSDRGPGISRDLRERVFEPFYRIRTTATRGHGLGLALIGHIARVHLGSATFVDTSVGARLRVELPAWRAKA